MDRRPRRECDGARLEIGIGRREDADAPERRLGVDVLASRRPVGGVVGQRQRRAHQSCARRLARQFLDVGDARTQCPQQLAQPVLRMALRVGALDQRLVLRRAERGIEPRQHQRAARQPGDGLEQLRRRRNRAGRARRDHRPFAIDQRRRLCLPLEPLIAGHGAVDPAVRREQRRPGLERDIEKAQDLPPVVRQIIRHQRRQRLDPNVLDDQIVDQPAE